MPSPIIIKTTFQLRRGKLAEWVLKNPIPADGEPCFADDVNILKIGNGTDSWNNLQAINSSDTQNIISRGYYFEGEFYVDEQHKEKCVGYSYKLYIDKNSNIIYSYDDEKKQYYSSSCPIASDSQAGISKLYNTLGNNTDGSISQDCVTDEIGKKFDINVDEDETIIFTNNKN